MSCCVGLPRGKILDGENELGSCFCFNSLECICVLIFDFIWLGNNEEYNWEIHARKMAREERGRSGSDNSI